MTERTQEVSARALLGRLRRKLAHEGKYVSKARRRIDGLGLYLVIDGYNTVKDGFDDLEEYADRYDCLGIRERLAA